jgi:hypothetical protein
MSHAPNTTWLWCTVLVLWSKVHRPFSFIGCMFEWVTVWLGSTGLRYNRRWLISFQSNVLSMFWSLLLLHHDWGSLLSLEHLIWGQYLLPPAGGSAPGEWLTDAVSSRVWAVSPSRTLKLCSTCEVYTPGRESIRVFVLRVGLNCSILFTFWKMSWLTENDEWIQMMYGKWLCIPYFLLGHTIIFTDQSGMNASGHVMLGTMDVHHQWTKVWHISAGKVTSLFYSPVVHVPCLSVCACVHVS